MHNFSCDVVQLCKITWLTYECFRNWVSVAFLIGTFGSKLNIGSKLIGRRSSKLYEPKSSLEERHKQQSGKTEFEIAIIIYVGNLWHKFWNTEITACTHKRHPNQHSES